MNKTQKETAHIIWFEDLRLSDVPLVGGKNAALGEMVSQLQPLGVQVPGGFAVTARAYNYLLEEAGVRKSIEQALTGVNTRDVRDLQKRGKKVRSIILNATLPQDLQQEISAAYKEMGKRYGKNTDVAVRSSATAEDLPGASFAGQQETFLNVQGEKEVIEAVKKCFASLFTDRAISYREDKGFSHFDVALSVAVQKMVRSDLASSGIMFTIDTETGFEDVVVINSTYGLGEMIVQGKVTPDEFLVFKPAYKKGYEAIIAQDMGVKDGKLIYAKKGIKEVPVQPKDRNRFSITREEVRQLAGWGITIEDYFSKLHGHHQPMDMEWAKDGKTGELFIVQARPETVHSVGTKKTFHEYRLSKRSEVLTEGTAVGTKISSGKVRVIKNVKEIHSFKEGEVLVTEITDPDWEPIMKIASAIVTDKGGRTSHAAIVSRELGIPCIVGTEDATRSLKNGQMVTVDCSSGKAGYVMKGELPYKKIAHHLDKIPTTRTKIMVNVGAPDEAFKNHFLPAKGVGLGRLEFIINSHIGIHPRALMDYKKIKRRKDAASRKLAKEIEARTPGYSDKAQFYVDELAEGVAKIGAAFYPHDVIIRFSDFKTNEYRSLLGGELYEPEEENPMIGWRGASRYHHEDFAEAFKLECRGIKKAREEMGVTNIVPMVPFCRTPAEAKEVVQVIEDAGLSRKKDKTLKLYMMCEIPSNVLNAEDFLKHFDGLSIGSNDLTQLTLGIDRDSNIVNDIGNEKDPAVKKLIADVIKVCRRHKKYIGICGQAPSDFPEFATFLVGHRIESISLNPDTVIPTLLEIAKKEQSLKKAGKKKHIHAK